MNQLFTVNVVTAFFSGTGLIFDHIHGMWKVATRSLV